MVYSRIKACCGTLLFCIAVFAGNPVANALDANVNWTRHGLDHEETRHSPLTNINTNNVSELGLAAYFETDDSRGLQATPLVIDGVLYFPGSWNRIYALNAKTAELLWTFDAQIDRGISAELCCGPNNRGLAVKGDQLFMGTLDGRLVSVDRYTGKLRWSVQTTPVDKPYSITGAPRVVDNLVIIGNSGAEYGARGFVTAYDVDSGNKVWRFHTVPGNPELGFESPAQESAANTWNGQWWRFGGGGTVWDGITYDPEFDQLLIGVGNGSPHNRRIRSPGGGDNLYLSSIVALDPKTGEYRWHYQEVPAETWDYTATQQITLATLNWDGKPTPVILHAPKAGFVYVIHRQSGKLLSAEPFVKVTWASHYDLETGRPVEVPGQDYADGPAMVFPAATGGHNWHPQAYNPDLKLLYIPSTDMAMEYKATPTDEYDHGRLKYNTGYVLTAPDMAQDLMLAIADRISAAALVAWDPVAQKPRWRVEQDTLFNGGVLSTAGNLVFQGTADGFMRAYHSQTGKQLWSVPVHNGVQAAPITYAVDGEQFVAVAVGRGGPMASSSGKHWETRAENGRLMIFALGGEEQLPPPSPLDYPKPPPRMEVSEETMERGRQLYGEYCFACHGANAIGDGSLPDLRRLPSIWHEQFKPVVLGGLMAGAGMPGFGDVLSEDDADAIHAFVIDRANHDHELRTATPFWKKVREAWVNAAASAIAWLTSD